MRIEIYASDNAWYSAEYDEFLVGNESKGYKLTVSGYSADAGDEMWPSNGQQFSTKDYGMHPSQAMMMQGGWWYSGFDNACLNGGYEFYMGSPHTGFYWNASYYYPPPPPLSFLADVKPGHLLMSRIMVARPPPSLPPTTPPI